MIIFSLLIRRLTKIFIVGIRFLLRDVENLDTLLIIHKRALAEDESGWKENSRSFSPVLLIFLEITSFIIDLLRFMFVLDPRTNAIGGLF